MATWEIVREGQYVRRERDGFLALDAVRGALRVTAQTARRLGVGSMTADLAVILEALENRGIEGI